VQRRRDGKAIVVDGRWALIRNPDGEPESILEINRDITARRQAEHQLQQSEERLRLLIDSVRDYAIFGLDPHGHVTSWNAAGVRIFGYLEEEIVGRHFSALYLPDDVAAGKPDRELFLASADDRVEDEGWLLHKDGHQFWANVVITATRDRAGRLRGFTKVTRDMTERRRVQEQMLEVERREAEKLREHAQRLAELERAKSQFLNLASHELRGPLAVVRGYLSMLADGSFGSLTPAAQKVIPVLVAKGEEMNRLVEQMVESARLEEGQVHLARAAYDLRDIVREAGERLQQTLQPSHTLIVDLPKDPIMVLVDRDRVATILANLLSNAVKYSPLGGEVRCRLVSTHSWATVEVEDHGVGVADADMGKLFKRFGRIVTGDTTHVQGTGLGLFLSRELARAHGGDITVVSEPGVGSIFSLSLPLA
jgi:PAS domain S-box-containing protein